MIELFRHLLDLIGQHPHLAVAAAFLVAMGEALPVIGLVVPSTVVLTGLGGLAGMGQLPFWPLFAASTLGAVAGDAVSYWLGRAYRGRLASVWPFSRYAGLLAAGELFFASHGGKSVVVGRFIPGIKAVVAAIAGMMGMGPLRFALLSVGSALAWTAAHLVSGYSAGAALSLAGTVSKRLAILLAVAAVAALLAIWLAHQSARLGARVLPRLQLALARWAEGSEARLAPVVLRLVSPDHADFRLFVLLLGLFGGAIIGFAAIAEDVITHAPELQIDGAVSQFLQSLRTPWADRAMVALTMLGDARVTVAVAAAATLALALARRWRLALALVTALAFASGFATLLKVAVRAPRPMALYQGTEAFSFPSGHATSAATLYGVLGLIAVLGLRPRVGAPLAALLAVLIGAVALSRVYLAAHWPSDVAAGLLFGAAATAGLALVFRRYPVGPGAAGAALAAAGAALLAAGALHLRADFATAAAIYAPPPPPEIALAAPWQKGGWRDLPAARIDLAGDTEEPLLLQWRGSPEALAAALRTLGWVTPPDWTAAALNAFAAGNSAPDALPVLPRLHNGRRPVLTAILPLPAGREAAAGRYVLRAWHQTVRAADGTEQPILLASVQRERIGHPLGLVTMAWQPEREACEATALVAALPQATTVGPERPGDCGGRTVLAGDGAAG